MGEIVVQRFHEQAIVRDASPTLYCVGGIRGGIQYVSVGTWIGTNTEPCST